VSFSKSSLVQINSKLNSKPYDYLYKYNTRKIHTKPHPGLEWCIFHILTSEDIDDFTDIKFVSYVVPKSVGILSKYLQVFLESLWQSSVIFGNLQQSSEQYLMLLPLEHKIHIFLPLCNILYILQVHVNYVP